MGYLNKSKIYKKAIALVLSLVLILPYIPSNTAYAAGGILTSLEIMVQPKVTEYTVGDSFNSKGLKVVANYSDGDVKNITNNNLIFDYDFSESGKKDVTISYTDGAVTKSTSISVDVYNFPVLSAEDGKAKVGEVIEVPVKISDNPGIMGLKIVVSYDDDIIKPVEVSDTDIFNTGYVNDNIATSEDNTFNIIWNGTENMSSDGKLLVIKFLCIKNPGNAKTEINISTDRNDTYTEKYNTIAVTPCKSIFTFEAVKAVDIDYTSVAIRKGTIYQLHATTSPDEYEYEWISLDENIASVDETGKITGVSSGETIIKAILKDDSDIFAECKVKVLDADEIEHEHEWTETILRKATCEVNGSKLTYCSICGESTEQKIDKLGHDFGEYISDNNATCLEDGTKTAKCSRCEKTDTIVDAGSAKGHKIVIDEAIKPTCTDEGKTEGKHCSVCNEVIVKQETIKALGHKWDAGKITKEATCTEDGIMTFTCENDSTHTKTEVIKASGHEWDDGVVTKSPTAKEDGVLTFTCKKCKNTRTIVIPATGEKSDTDQPGSDQKPTDKPVEQPDNDQSKTEDGVGTISADGKTLTDEEGVKYFTIEYITEEQLKTNLTVADKKRSSKYKIIKVIKKNGKVSGGTVAYMKPYNKNCTKATIPATVKIGGVKFKVTALNKNAFKNCKNLSKVTIGKSVTKIGANAFNGASKLKTITIKATKLKSIGRNAFKGINAKAKFKVPKKQLKKYTKMIKKAKAPKKAKITK